MKTLTLRATLFVSALALGLLHGCTDAGRCELGTVGCLCDRGTCEPGGRCSDGLCEECPRGSESCPCAAGDECNAGLSCVTSEDVCVPTEDTVCEDSCYFEWNGDGVCDDGGEGAAYSACHLGTDCSDCGARRNPCTDPDYPVFCPATPNYPSQCWEAGVDCDSIHFCGGNTPSACFEGYRFDCETSTCVVNACAGSAYPVFCDYDASCESSGTDCCFQTHADCSTTTQCFGSYYTCLGRRANGLLQVSCGATEDDIACILAPE